MKIHLVRDCLDKQVVDPGGRKLGRIDGIVIEVGGRGRPRVVEVHVGSATLAQRLPWPFSRCAEYLIQKLFVRGFVAITWKHLTIDRNEVLVDSNKDLLRLREVENWVCEHIVSKIPGA
jgi:hypothetical protein